MTLLTATAFGAPQLARGESDIAKVWFDEGSLVSVVASARDERYRARFGNCVSQQRRIQAPLQGMEMHRRDWLVVIGNACVSVFAAEEPALSPVSWHWHENPEYKGN